MRRVGSRPGFTLIELLVVIAIIAIIAAILLPVFARAREKARQITCISNLKELALALNLYKEDFDEMNLWFRGRPNGLGAAGPQTVAAGMNPSGCYGGTNDCNSWAGGLIGSAPGQYPNVPSAWKGIVSQYVKNSGIFICPSDAWSANSGRHSCSYDGAPVTMTDATGQQVGGAFLAWDPSIRSLADASYGGQLAIDHYYTSYRFYKRASGDTTCIKDDQGPGSFWDIAFDKGVNGSCPPANSTIYGGCVPISAYVGGTVIHLTPASDLLLLEEWSVHQAGEAGPQGYGRDAAYRDGHAKWMPANEYLVR